MIRGPLAITLSLVVIVCSLRAGGQVEAAFGVSPQIGAGPFHTCALRLDGSVWCWGEGTLGQLGNGANASSNVPVQVQGIDDAVGITAGGDPATLSRGHSCALLRNGSVKCWGSNSLGQLGDGTQTNSNVPVIVGGTGVYKQIASGHVHVCALKFSGEPFCWGSNNGGQLGFGNTNSPQLTPASMTGDLANGVAQIAVGTTFTCGLKATGTVYCTGTDFDGRLGNGGANTHVSTPTLVTSLTVTTITLATNSACARIDNGTASCWGNNAEGQLGTGNNTGLTAPGAQVMTLTDIKVLGHASISSHHCAVAGPQSTVWCWGNNSQGQLGNLSTSDSDVPVQVESFNDPGDPDVGFVGVATGALHSCGIDVSGLAYCWGDNSSGQLGDGTTTDATGAVRVSGPGFLWSVKVSTGNTHTCAQAPGQGPLCWGNNSSGQLGDGSTTQRLSPVGLNGGTAEVLALDAGGFHTCMVWPGNDSVYCWGNNGNGQLGDGTTVNRSDPDQIPGFGGIIDVSAGTFHTCALRGDGIVFCWGQNASGQLGIGNNTEQTSPTQVPGVSGVVQISAGGLHTCALLVAGEIACWGENGEGQLGNFSTVDSNVPVIVGDVGSATGIAAGASHSCAVRADGSVRCWGRGDEGQIGNGLNEDRDNGTGVQGTGPAGLRARAVVAGFQHSCALFQLGLIACWGGNGFGQLGDDTTVGTNTPVYANVAEASQVIAGGGSTTCAVIAHGEIRCWGLNSFGQIGDGSTSNRTSAVPIGFDTDGDGCSDAEELAQDPVHGGDRSNVDFWDFFDVTFDKAADVADVIAILGDFGLSPGAPNYTARFDRVAPDPTKRYRTAQATEPSDVGIDVADAILNLQSFGHTCAGLP